MDTDFVSSSVDAHDLIDGLEATVDAARELIATRRPTPRRKQTAFGTEEVTDLDVAIEVMLVDRVRELRPAANIVSEELNPDAALVQGLNVVIDPIDGTSQLLRGSRDFACCIAVIEDGRSLAALLDLPARKLRLRSRLDGSVTANERAVQKRSGRRRGPASIAVSATQLAGMSARLAPSTAVLRPVGACAPKLATVITGECVAAIRLPVEPDTLRLWDFAAGGHLLERLGMTLTDLDCVPLMDTLPPVHTGGWIATASDETDSLLRDIL